MGCGIIAGVSMATDFDQFPLYDPIIKKGTEKLSDIWVGSISTFYMNLIGYLTQGGILMPQVTTAQRDALQNVQNGQMIYNTTLGSAQYFKAGVWTSF
jgi:hypothetical protein